MSTASIHIENTTKTSAVIRFEGFEPPVNIILSHQRTPIFKSARTEGDGFVEVNALSPGILYDIVASSTSSYESLHASFRTLSLPKPSTPKLSVDYYSRDRFRAGWSSDRAEFYRVRIFRDGWEDSFDTERTQIDQPSRGASQVAVHVQAHRASEVSASSSAYVNRPESLPPPLPKPPDPNLVPPPPSPKQTPTKSVSKEKSSLSAPVGYLYLASIIYIVLTLLSGCQMAQEGNHFLIIIIASPIVAAVWLAMLGFYFLPTCIAVARKTSNKGSIFGTNLFLGWTILGWIVALVWSISG